MDPSQPIQQSALQKSDEQFRLLVQSVSDYAIYMLDPQGIVVSWNFGARRIKGYTSEEIVGKHFSVFYSVADREAGLPQQGLAAAAKEGRWENEGWRYRRDGSQFWASVVIDRILDDQGALVGFAKVTRDMTERREAQLALEHARDAMAQSQKMDAIGQLSGGVAHDFNNLLMAVLGSLELLEKRLPNDPKMKLLLNNAFEGARRGVTLTQRMLSFARRRELELTAVNVGELISGMQDLLDRSLGPLVTLEIDVPTDLPTVRADPNQLETAVLNLAVNSRDAMARGGLIRIHARVQRCDELLGLRDLTHDCVVLSVTDTGEGMDESTLRRAMEPFFTTKEVGKGTGLGLSMVHGMTEQLGGRLKVSSHVGQGTAVEMWLPVDGAAVVKKEHLESAPARESRARKLVTVVVDDDRLVLTNTAAMLEDAGHTVLAASSASQALELIRKAAAHVDLVITDQAMPQMTGMQLAAAIRVEWPAIPILLVCGFAELPDNPLKVPKLAKPYSLADLQRAIETLTRATTPPPDVFGSSYRD
jgi:PAS domain S-box-containing protein